MMLDRMKVAIEAVIEAVVGSRLDYLARYPARVVSQDGNRLELKPDDPRIPGISGVPIRVGVLGMVVEVPSGSRVLLAFEGGDPSRPIAEIWESGTPIVVKFSAKTQVVLEASQIKLGEGALKGVARLGDTVGPYVITSASTKVLSE